MVARGHGVAGDRGVVGGHRVAGGHVGAGGHARGHRVVGANGFAGAHGILAAHSRVVRGHMAVGGRSPWGRRRPYGRHSWSTSGHARFDRFWSSRPNRPEFGQQMAKLGQSWWMDAACWPNLGRIWPAPVNVDRSLYQTLTRVGQHRPKFRSRVCALVSRRSPYGRRNRWGRRGQWGAGRHMGAGCHGGQPRVGPIFGRFGAHASSTLKVLHSFGRGGGGAS